MKTKSLFLFTCFRSSSPANHRLTRSQLSSMLQTNLFVSCTTQRSSTNHVSSCNVFVSCLIMLQARRLEHESVGADASVFKKKLPECSACRYASSMTAGKLTCGALALGLASISPRLIVAECQCATIPLLRDSSKMDEHLRWCHRPVWARGAG